MKLATFLPAGTLGAPRLGVLREGGLVDVVAAAEALQLPVPARSVKAALTGGPAILDAVRAIADRGAAAGLLHPEKTVALLPPIPDPSKFFCVGKNSRVHREELVAHGMLTEQPNEPTGFIKLASTMVGQDARVVRPDGIATLDYEPELVFVIGMRAHGVSRDDAMRHVAGITLFNDVTAREVQKREVKSGSRFWTAKNMPGFAPIGPYIATMDEVADPDDLWVTCDVNGQRRLRENSSQYIFKIAELVAFFSRYVVFEAGDLVAMGAPKGTAMSQPNADALYLRPGDRMAIAIEGLMTLRTEIVGPD